MMMMTLFTLQIIVVDDDYGDDDDLPVQEDARVGSKSVTQ